jgi:hypothetical protein
MNKFNKHIILYLIYFFVIALNFSYGQRIKAPMDVQMKIIPKVLSLDKNFASRVKGDFKIGVIYSSQQRTSVQIKNDFEDVAIKTNMLVKKSKVNAFFIDVSKITNIKKFLVDNKIDVIYVTPLRGVDISSIAKICKQEKILTVTGVLDYMQNDISVSFDIKDKKLQIVINNNAAKREGTNFSSRLLRIAKII